MRPNRVKMEKNIAEHEDGARAIRIRLSGPEHGLAEAPRHGS
jgi:hypothetical protein